MKGRWTLQTIVVAGAFAFSHSQAQSVPATKLTAANAQIDWRTVAGNDVEAVAELILDTHPAMQPEVGDPEFMDTFRRAKSIALGFADRTTAEAAFCLG